jgi:putative heme iron utilization protein
LVTFYGVANSHRSKVVAKSDHLKQIAAMLQQHRWVALATVGERGQPAASMVAYAVDAGQGCLYLHLSGLAAHTKELCKRPAAGMVISECDSGNGDPQQLARLSLHGSCEVIAREEPGYVAAKQCYLQRLPDAEPLFNFGDFILFRFVVEGARFVGGFGQAHSYRQEEIRRLLK